VRTLAYIARRLFLVALVMVVVSVLIFAIVQLLPGDVAVMILGTSATDQDLAALRLKLGLDRPGLVRYVDWITGALRGEWGSSLLYQVPVRPLVLERLGQSAVLAGVALAVAVPLAIGLGVLSALRRGRWLDQAVSLVTLVSVSLP
jgi:peptide/nickel transport system permease protein